MVPFRHALLSAFFAATLTVPASAALERPAASADWTILVFLNANNDLDPFSSLNLNEMETVGSTAKVNVVVQVTHRDANKTLRYLMKKDADPKTVTTPVLETLPKQDMGDHRTLAKFIEWGMEKYPARHYFVDIWNHGSGWEKKLTGAITRGISYDDSTGHHITTPQLGAVLKGAAAKRGSKIDVIGYDACLMQMAEVASEVSEGARFQVGSEEVEPGKGWPYAEWLAWLTAHSDSDGAGVGKALVEAFRASYSGGSHGSEATTLSTVDLSKIDAVSKAADAFSAAALADRAHRKDLLAAIQASQAYSDPLHHDVNDLVDQVVKRLPSTKQAGAALKSAVNAAVLSEGHTGGPVARSGGLAIWAPTRGASNLADYDELRWSHRGQWNEFVAALATGEERSLQQAMNFRALFGE